MRVFKSELDCVAHYEASRPAQVEDGVWLSTLTELYSVRFDGSARREGAGSIHIRRATHDGLVKALNAMATPEWEVSFPSQPIPVGATASGGEWTPGATAAGQVVRVFAATRAEALTLANAPAEATARKL